MNKNNSHNTKRLGAIMLIIAWIIAIAVIAVIFQNILYSEPTTSFDSKYNAITIPKSRDGHFRVAGTINDIPVVFLLDTGATRVAVPQHIADKAQLLRQHNISSSTAAGITTAYSTHINKISVSNIDFQNIAAVIMPSMSGNEVLLGMNLLKYFQLSTENNVLTLTIISK